MKRIIPFRAKTTPIIEARLASLEGAERPVKLFLVQTLGPTLFMIRHEYAVQPSTAEPSEPEQQQPASRKYKVAIGNPQRCSCGDKEICIHILFCMTKVLGVPKDHPLTWQRALVEREINDVCSGQIARAARAASQTSSERSTQHTNFLRSRRQTRSRSSSNSDTKNSAVLTAQRKPIDQGDKCPVCLEGLIEEATEETTEEATNEITANSGHLVYCKKGCGKNVHVACMLVWAEHQNDINKKITCPLCRVDWGPLALTCLRNGGVTPKQRDRHRGIICANCPNASVNRNAIVGIRHRCLVCADYDLCDRCFTSSSVHAMHQFVSKKQSKGNNWMPDMRSRRPRMANLLQQQRRTSSTSSTSSTSLNAHLLSLQHREITPNDYQMLMSLDGSGNRNGNRNFNRNGMTSSTPTSASLQLNLSSTQIDTNASPSLSKYLVETLVTYGGSRPSRRELSEAKSAGAMTSTPPTVCVACTALIPTTDGVRLPCTHRTHKQCLVQTFETEHYCCPHPECCIPIYRGLNRLMKMKMKNKENKKETSSTMIGNNEIRNISAQALFGPSLMSVTGISTGSVTTRSVSADGVNGVNGGVNGVSGITTETTHQIRAQSSRRPRRSRSVQRQMALSSSSSSLSATTSSTLQVGKNSTESTSSGASGRLHRRRPMSSEHRQRIQTSSNETNDNTFLPEEMTNHDTVSLSLEVQVLAARIHMGSTATLSLPVREAVPEATENIPVTIRRKRRTKKEKETKVKRNESSKNNSLNVLKDPSPPSIFIAPAAAIPPTKSKIRKGKLRKGARAQRLRPSLEGELGMMGMMTGNQIR